MQQGKSLLNAHIQETWHIQVVWTWQKKGTLQLTRKIFPYITFPLIVFFLCMLILTTLEIFDKYSKHYMVLLFLTCTFNLHLIMRRICIWFRICIRHKA